MVKFPIRLDTMKDVTSFVAVCAGCKNDVKLVDNCGNCVNGKSMLGVLYSLEFDQIFCVCEYDDSYCFDSFRI